MDVKVVARLAHIPITEDEQKELAKGFTKVLSVLDQLNSLNVTNIEPTHQVTGLENILREDEIDPTRIFTVEEALANAPRSYNGFFVVDQVLEQ